CSKSVIIDEFFQSVRHRSAFAHRTAIVVPTGKIVSEQRDRSGSVVSDVRHRRESDNECSS
ncbi:hypothetical protein, partial [Mesorhizobium sp.]|uniref:hypothetical protein n=1 Tax=Mesorhizobium sp. TaxID=1871066 RepID=UPI0025BC4849